MLARSMLVLALLLPSIAYAEDAGVSPDAGALVLSDAGVAVPPIVVDPATGTVTASPGTLPDRLQTDPIDTGKEIVEAVKGGQWRLLAAAILAGIMILGVRFGARMFGTTDRRKAIAVMVYALLGTLSAALATDTPVTLELLAGAVTVAFTAVGGRQWLSRLLWPQDKGEQVAEWLKPVLGVKPGDPPPT